MSYRTMARGSALVLVVGLLTIVVMLGASFLVVAHLDSRQARAIANKSEADPIAEGIVAQLRTMMKDDLHIDNDTDGPYEGVTTGEWHRNIDYPYQDAAGTTSIDAWLSSQYTDGMANWPHVTNVADIDADEVNNVSLVSTKLVDTNGDGTRDAYLFDTGVTNAEGWRYYAAVRVEDLSGKICVNTAARCDAGEETWPTGPAGVNLSGYLNNPGIYDRLHIDRCGSGSRITNNFNTNVALRLLTPATGYRPFSMGDELFLRWLGPSPAATETGRLYNRLSGLSANACRYLTTFSSSRLALRRPADAAVDGLTCPLTPDISNSAKRQRIYEQMLHVLRKLEISPDDDFRKRCSAHFVANLWAYQSGWATGQPWKFTPLKPDDTPDTFCAYGVVPMAIISEAYAAHNAETGAGAGDNLWFAAVELFNPYSLDFNLAQYTLAGVNLSGTLSKNGGRRVFYNMNCTAGEVTTEFGITIPAGWTRIDDANFKFYRAGSGNKIVMLKRGEVPADQVSSDDLGHIANISGDPGEHDDARRDDNTSRSRYTIAAYVHTTGAAVHRLGLANNVGAAEIASAPYPAPIYRLGAPLVNFAEMGRIYFTGPINDNGALTAFSVGLTDGALKGAFPDDTTGARGRIDFHPSTISAKGWGPPAAGPRPYPNVPAAALVGEFFTVLGPDATRQDGTNRIYGKINVNTATVEVLQALPWPTSFTVGATDYPVNAATAARYILAYRDKTPVPGGPDYRDVADGGVGREAACGIANLRAAGTFGGGPGFLSAAEVAIPLADYANQIAGIAANPDRKKHYDYLVGRDTMFNAISNLITVSSDACAASIYVALYAPDKTPPADAPKYIWRYVAVVDRSNCMKQNDRPAVLLFSEIK